MIKHIILLFIALFMYFSNIFYSKAQTIGLITQNPGSLDGYVLFAPNFGNTTYLIDKCGYQVHSWTSTHQPGQSAYFLEDGSLLRTGKLINPVFNAGGLGGIIEKFDWAGNITWSYTISNTTECQHHDIRPLPNGNVLAISYELKTAAQAVAAGANPANTGPALWSEKILEIQPVGSNSGNVVWEWHAWDHLIQDYDSTKQNYGVVADHPELLNLNYNLTPVADWLHCNALDYNASLDQIILSSHNLNEFYIIDHSTTISEAAGHTGGSRGKGGDFLYRWGNPASYDRGAVANKKLFGQHNPRWIENGMPGAGNIMIFNNGINRPGGNYSTVDIIAPPVDSLGNYSIVAGQAYLPAAAYWSYQAPVPTSFYAMNISGAQRLSNGNTLICSGPNGNFFEIDSAMNLVWKYVCPVGPAGVIFSQGTTPTQNSVFRCTLYEPAYAGFTGLPLSSGNPIELNPLSYTCSMITGIHGTGAFSDPDLRAFPNPFNSHIHVPSMQENETVELKNCFGQLIYSGNNIESRDFSYLAEGFYVLQIKSGQQTIHVKLIHQLY